MRQAFLLAMLLGVACSAQVAPPVCVSCHRQESLHQPQTAMGRAMIKPSDRGVMGDVARLEFRDGKYVTTIEREGGGGLKYIVSDGVKTETTPVEWAFGMGAAGQTYILKIDGQYYESRVSYFQKLQGLDYTLGAKSSKPANLREAFGRELSTNEARKCFGCHSTPHQPVALAGLQCERCHGDAAAHAASFAAGKPVAMKKLSTMTSEETNEFCGQCHRTWAYIAENGPRSPANVRFQPYRLTNSKCYDAVDRRISCIACHNPHENLTRNSASYDSKCQACHSAKQSGAKLCSTGKKDCVSCHMPKYELDGAHYEFTDHNIRIVRKGAAYPI